MKERIKSICIPIAIFTALFIEQCYIKEISSFIDPYRTILLIASIVGLTVSCLEQFQHKKWAFYVSLFSYYWFFQNTSMYWFLIFEKYEWILWGFAAILLYLGIKYNIIDKFREVKFSIPRYFAIAGCYTLVFLEVFFKIVRYIQGV